MKKFQKISKKKLIGKIKNNDKKMTKKWKFKKN